MSEVWERISTTIDRIPRGVQLGFMAVGSLYLLRNVPKPLVSFYRHYLRGPLDFAKRYGAGTWVVITGGAKGIGFGFACEFAKRRFNLILIDKDDNIEIATEKLRREYNVEVIGIKNNLLSINDTITELENIIESRNLDVSVLINTAAEQEITDFKDTDPDKIEAIFKVNAWAHTKLTRTMINRLYNRPKRSAIINLSSILGCYHCPHNLIYSCTKVYLRFFSYGLREEVGDRIDVLSVEPGMVSTDITKNPKTTYWVASVDECVQGALKELGRGPETFGSRKHALGMWYHNLRPDMEAQTKKYSDFIWQTVDWSNKTGRSA